MIYFPKQEEKLFIFPKKEEMIEKKDFRIKKNRKRKIKQTSLSLLIFGNCI